MEDSTVFSDSPVAMADKWVELGAKRIHLVDLDGAFAGKPANAEIIHEIAERHPTVPIQIGGGIRDEKTIEAYLDAGVEYVIIGTRAVNEPHSLATSLLNTPVILSLGSMLRTEKWQSMVGLSCPSTM